MRRLAPRTRVLSLLLLILMPALHAPANRCTPRIVARPAGAALSRRRAGSLVYGGRYLQHEDPLAEGGRDLRARRNARSSARSKRSTSTRRVGRRSIVLSPGRPEPASVVVRERGIRFPQRGRARARRDGAAGRAGRRDRRHQRLRRQHRAGSQPAPGDGASRTTGARDRRHLEVPRAARRSRSAGDSRAPAPKS